MGTLFLPIPPPPWPYTSPPVIAVIPTPSPFSPTKLTTHGPFSLLFFSPFFLFSLPPLSSSDGDLSRLCHRCRRHPKIRISSIFHPTSSSLSLVFHGFFICASPPLFSDFDRHLSGSGSGSGSGSSSSTVRIPPRPPSPSLAPPPWPDPQPTTASLSFLLFLFPPPLPSISLVFLHRRRRLPVSPPAPPTPPASPFFFPFSSPMQSPTTSIPSHSRRDTGSSFPTSLSFFLCFCPNCLLDGTAVACSIPFC